MKKILLGTTAIIALSTLSAEAFAAEPIKLELGGFMRHYVGVINNDEASLTTPVNGVDRSLSLSQFNNSEVYFSGGTTLDNGLAVDATIQREAGSGVTGGDRSYLSISSDGMGALTIGSDAHAGDDFRVGAPNAGNFDHGDFADWAGTASDGTTAATTAGATAGDITDMGGNDLKLKYASPSFGGVSVFASYSAAEGGAANDARRAGRNGTNDGTTIGAAFSGEVGGAAVDASVIQLRANGVNNATHYGLNAGMGGFTVGGSYVNFSDDKTVVAALNAAAADSADGKGYELGVGYETGAYSLSARYMNAKSDGLAATAGSNEDTVWSIAATYDLGAGVALSGTYFDASYDAEGTTASVDTSGIIAGIEVGF